jgi:hypothetical protein
MKLTNRRLHEKEQCKDGFERECVHAAGYPNCF